MKPRKLIGNFIWRLAERFGARGVTFIVSLILARLLDADVYGSIALVTVFITIFQVFVDSGLGTALVQKKDADELDFSSVFYFNLAVCLILYAILFVISGPLAVYFRTPEMRPVFRVLGLSLLISGVKNIQQAYVARNMLFKKFFFATLSGTLGAAGIGIYLAWKSYGVWALVAQFLFNDMVDTIILWITVPWRPKKLFSAQRLRGLLSFGWKLLAVSLISTLSNSLRSLIIGKRYTKEDLAYYNRGQQFPQIIALNVDTAIDSILLPTMSQEQDKLDVVLRMTRKAIRIETYVMMPMMMGLAVCSRALISLLITDKWLPCVPYLQILCVIFAFYSVSTTKYNAYKSIGRSDVYLKMTTITSFVDIMILLVSMPYGVMAIALGGLASAAFNHLANAVACKKLFAYRYWDQLMDLIPNSLLSLAMGAAVYAVFLLHLPTYLTLAVQVILGVVLYVLLSRLFHVESFDYMLGMLRREVPVNDGKESV